MKKLIILACLAKSTTAIAELNLGVLTGLNITNGNIESFRTDLPDIRYYKTTHNARLFSAGVCAGYDYFFKSLMLGIDTYWLHNQNKWREISKVSPSERGMREAYEKISIRYKPQYSAGIRVGYLSGKFLPYLRLGREKIKFDIRLLSYDLVRGPSNFQWSRKRYATSIGAGLEYKAYDDIWLRFEGRYINTKSYKVLYESKAYDNDATLKFSSQRILLTAGIIYRF